MTTRTLLKIAAGLGSLLGARALVRARRRLDLADKVVVVTGGSRGLGLVLARRLIAAGARVAICARDHDELERARVDLTERGGHVFAAPCDVTDRHDVQRFITEARDELGPIDVLINNAGVVHVGPMELMDLDDYEQAMRTHLWAPLHATLAVLPEMRRRRQGRVVNIASIGGKIPIPHLVPYTASKFALVGMSAAMRAELAGDGVLVTTVCPGLMRTGSPLRAWFKGDHQAEYAWFSILEGLPLSSMSADHAARAIVDACVHGDAEVVLTLPARLGAALYGLAPNLLDGVLALAARALPASTGSHRAVQGRPARADLAPSGIPRSPAEAAAREL